MIGKLTPTPQQYANFSDHELATSLAIYDENWTHYLLTCKPEYFSQYVYERSRCQEEILYRKSIEFSFDIATDSWATLKLKIKSTREYNLDNARYEENDDS